MSIELYYDDEQEINWFISLDARLEDMEKKVIRGRGRNENEIINELIIYDRPDIIVVVDNEPKLVIEKTEEVPSGHNVGQRIARLVRAAELNIPIIKFFPFLAMKHGKYASRCFVRPNIFLAFQKMKEFHGVHALAINWQCDKDYELIRDGSENSFLKKLISSFIENNYNLNGMSETIEAEKIMNREYTKRVASNSSYRRLAPSLSISETNRVLSEISNSYGNQSFENYITERNISLIYTIKMTPQNCRREDPYTGTQFIYDYIYCRTGSSIYDRNKNFLLKFPLITKKRWIDANPLDINRKSFLWYTLADFIILKDGILKRSENFEQ